MPNTAAPMRWNHGLTKYHYLVLAVAACGWLFDTMDQWIYVLARNPALSDLLSQQMGLPTSAKEVGDAVKEWSGFVQATFLFGWATGGLFFGIVGDRLGRTTTMAITVLIYAVFTGASGFAQGPWDFTFYRFMTGLGIGGEFAAGASLVAEVFPAHARAMALGIMQACSAIGNIAAGVIGYTVATASADPARWRIMFLIGFAPALMAFIVRLLVKEPEVYKEARDQAKKGQIQLGAISELLSNPVLRRNLLVGVSLAAVGVIGFWGIGTYSTDLLKSILNPKADPALGQHTERMMALGVIAQNSGSFFGMLGFAIMAQYIGRRYSFVISLIACAMVVPFTFHSINAGGTLTIALLLLPIMGFATSSLFGGYAVYFPEIFPTRLRATGTGICYNVARYIAISGPIAFTQLSVAYGIPWAATMVSSVFIMGLLIIPFAPETKGKALPE